MYCILWCVLFNICCIVLHCVTLCCIVLHCFVLCCIVLSGVVLHCVVLCCRVVLCCIVLYCCVALYCVVLCVCCIRLYCAVLYYIILCCIELCCVVLCCIALSYSVVLCYVVLCCVVLCCIALYYSVELCNSVVLCCVVLYNYIARLYADYWRPIVSAIRIKFRGNTVYAVEVGHKHYIFYIVTVTSLLFIVWKIQMILNWYVHVTIVITCIQTLCNTVRLVYTASTPNVPYNCKSNNTIYM